MEHFAWDVALETGDGLLDTQHQQLFALADAVARAAEADSHDPEVVADAVWRLSDYVTEHFADEEEAMAGVAWPGLPVHRSLHEHLTAEVLRLTTRFFQDEDIEAAEIASFLIGWLRGHILSEDASYVAFARERG